MTSKYGAEPEKVSTLYATKDSLWIFIGFLVLAFGWGLFNKKLWLIISFLVLALILRWALFNEKPGKGGIQQLRGPNFTQFWPPSPQVDKHWYFTYYLPFVTWPPWTFYGPHTPSSCPHSYWMPPKEIKSFLWSIFCS